MLLAHCTVYILYLIMRMANPVQVIKMTPDAKAKAKAKEKASSSEGGHSPDQVRNNMIEIFNYHLTGQQV